MRIGGGVFSDLPIVDGITLSYIRRIADLQGELLKQAGILTDSIARLLPHAYDLGPQLGKRLLKLKRDVHNLRFVAAEQIDKIECFDSAGLLSDLRRFADQVTQLGQLKDQQESVYGSELEDYLRAVTGLSAHPNISTAIRITNPKFAEAFANLDWCEQIEFDRKAAQRATTLLRYGLRAIHKTSPLSSLGLVGLVRPIVAAKKWDGELIDVSGSLRRSVQAQFRVLEQLLEQLCADPQLLSDWAPIRLNRSLAEQDDECLWTYRKLRLDAKVAVSGTQSVEARSTSAFVQLMVKLLKDQSPLGKADLRTRAIAMAPKVEANYSALLQQAWQSKVIELAIPDSQDQFDQIRIAVEVQAAERRSRLKPLLDQCKEALQQNACPAVFGPALYALQAAADLPAGLLTTALVDDCMFDTSGLSGIEDVFPGPVAQFATLVRLVPLLTCAEPMRAIERWLAARFIAEAGVGGTMPNASAFIDPAARALEGFLRQGPPSDGSQDSFFERLGIARDPSVNSALDLLLHTLISRASDGQTRLSCDDADQIIEAIPSASLPVRLSKLIYYQPVRDDNGNVNYVINSIYPGYASMFSRFIKADTEEFDATRDYLNKSAAQGGFAELGGHFGFNANHHPLIADHTVVIPPFHYGEDAAIRLTELAIAHNQETNALEFIDTAGSAIDLHFLGVIQPFMLPLPYLLIQAISQSVVRVPKLDLMLIERGTVTPQGLIDAPRVLLDDLVISRRCTAVPFQTLPDPSVADSEFFTRFNTWADQTGLPERMFYRFATVVAFRDADAVITNRSPTPRQDKPMPLDRASPALVRLFQRDLKGNPLDVLFSEALPDFGQSVFIRDGEPIIAELGLELTVNSRS